MPQLLRDLSYSLRSLARTPALAATIIMTVGVGLGATTGMVSVIRAVLLNPLPYAEPDRLFWIYTDAHPFKFRFSLVDYRALEADHPAFSAVAAYQTRTVTLTQGDLAERATAKSVTGSYFSLLGQSPLAGRLFDPSDDGHGDRIAVLTEGYWGRRFGGDRSVVGRTVTVDGESYTVVGVLQNTNGPLENNVSLFTAARWPPPRRKGPFNVMVIGRLRPDVSPAAALEPLRATNRALFPIWKSSYQDEKATWGVQDLKSRVVGDVRTTMLLVLGAVTCVLLIACANAVNLLVARALDRRREWAIRGALGASRGRLLQQLLVESVVLAGASAAAGLGVAVLAVNAVRSYGQDYIPRLNEVQWSPPVIAWLAGLAAVSGAFMFMGGLLSVVRGRHAQMDQTLRSAGRSSTAGPATRRIRHALVATEFALATPLLVAALLVLASLDRLQRVSVGIDAERVLTAELSLPGARYPEDTDRRAFWDRLRERISSLPGVDAVSFADSRPPSDAGNLNNFDLEDRPTPAGLNQPLSTWVAVSPDFFRTAGLTLERGRLLDEHSVRDNVIVVDRAWADRFFPGQDALGRRLHEGGCSTCPWISVAGVVSTVKWTGLERADEGTVYMPFVDLSNGFVVMRATGDPAQLTTALRASVREVDPGLALANVATGEELVSESLATPRYLSVLVGMFAAAAMCLSIVGVYGVMAYFVQQHRRDIGIRLALGGEPSVVGRMIVMKGLRLVAVGVVIGVPIALMAARFLRTVLFEVGSTDLVTVAAVPAMLLLIAAAACAGPGRRAANLAPADILRES